MSAFRDLPINQKLMVILMSVTTATLLLNSLGIMGADYVLFRRSLERDVAALSQIVADNSTAALAFDDPRIAAETLASLRARPHMVAACTYRANGALFAKYLRQGSVIECPPLDSSDGKQLAAAGLVIRRSVELKGQKIGTLLLLYDLGEIADRTILYGGIVLGVFAVSGLMAFLLSSGLRSLITSPLLRLVSVTTSVSKTGDYRIRAQRESNDELGVLADGFNEMLTGIQSRDNSLQEALRRFRFMAESMPQKIFTTTPSGEVDYLNQQWVDFTGLAFEEMHGRGWMQIIHSGDRDETLHSWQHSIDTGEPFQSELRFRRADGEYRWHLCRAHGMLDLRGNISMWIGSHTDIHHQKEKEEELRRANDDLQQFVYSASHDLQEPVRNVAIYSEIVGKRFADRLDEEGQQYLGFLKEGGRRLATLIRDLLAYTRAGVFESARTKSDSAEVLRHTLSALAEVIRESGANITFDPLPEVFIGDAHLQQLFQNLITNAIRYRKEETPCIHVSALKAGDDWRFSVQDNGIGIDPQYKEKIFGVFKRLHHDEKYGGTGIGLAICQRLVERYGGRIWVESREGEGATFFFTIPVRQIHPTAKSVAS